MLLLNNTRQLKARPTARKGSPARGGRVGSSSVSTINGYLKVYPNPTTGLEYFEFKLPCADADGLLVVADMTGRAMYNVVVGSDVTLKIINTSAWTNGVYLYKLSCNSKTVGTGKFNKIR